MKKSKETSTRGISETNAGQPAVIQPCTTTVVLAAPVTAPPPATPPPPTPPTASVPKRLEVAGGLAEKKRKKKTPIRRAKDSMRKLTANELTHVQVWLNARIVGAVHWELEQQKVRDALLEVSPTIHPGLGDAAVELLASV